MSLPRIYSAINAVANALSACGIAKRDVNLDELYAYRSVDDVYGRIGPLLAANKLCVLPRVLRRLSSERTDSVGAVLTQVVVRVAYDFVSAEDGSAHTIEAFGEALDGGDKATAKAMQSAFKYALLQTFCVPLGPEDADASCHRLKTPLPRPRPPQGWQRWASEISALVGECESVEAIDQLQASHREYLLGLAREQRELYEQVGMAVAARRAKLAEKQPKARSSREGGRRNRVSAKEAVAEAACG
jgi:hypothetical protein